MGVDASAIFGFGVEVGEWRSLVAPLRNAGFLSKEVEDDNVEWDMVQDSIRSNLITVGATKPYGYEDYDYCYLFIRARPTPEKYWRGPNYSDIVEGTPKFLEELRVLGIDATIDDLRVRGEAFFS